jgi:hypothetical protein
MVVDVCRSTGAAAGFAQGRWAQKGGPKDSRCVGPWDFEALGPVAEFDRPSSS